MENNVREGFLCPICMKDLRSYHKLQSHFETAHTAEDKALLNQIKGLFGKAKGRFLGQGDIQASSTSYSSQYSPQPVITAPIWETQEFGVTRSHKNSFKKMRDARVDRMVIESNKILIRLDKLLFLDQLSKSQRKEFEKTLVPWVKDADVPFCPTCGDKFNVARRRHHCRLCGSIMCTKCSIFIPFELADELVVALRKPSVTSQRFRSASMSTIRQVSERPDPQIRCCCECDKILMKRKKKMEEESNQPLLVLLYEKLETAMASASKSAPEYKIMAESLNQGEEDYDLSRANEMRFKMIKFYETIDVVSKKIAALNTNDADNPPPRSAIRLQTSIRQAAHAYLQENMLTLQSLPSLPKLEVLQKQRRQEQERKRREMLEIVEQERVEAKRVQELERLKNEREAAERRSNELLSRSSQPRLVLDNGWSSVVPRSRGARNGEPSDPILEQITLVKQMISQAESAGRPDEVKSLILNLNELKNEYNRQRAVHAFSPPNSVSSSAHTSPQRSRNPFLDEDDKKPTSRVLYKDAFIENNVDSKNPFLNHNDSNNTNPFLEKDATESEKDPLLDQICYVTKRLDEAIRLGQKDDIAILRKNLAELQGFYSG